MKKINLTQDQEELKAQLAKEVYDVCVLGGTEAPFTGELLNEKREGTFNCAVCSQELFSSKSKFESGTGWPSFYDVIESGKVEEEFDDSYEMRRTEVVCSNCGAPLGMFLMML